MSADMYTYQHIFICAVIIKYKLILLVEALQLTRSIAQGEIMAGIIHTEQWVWVAAIIKK